MGINPYFKKFLMISVDITNFLAEFSGCLVSVPHGAEKRSSVEVVVLPFS